MRRSGLIAMSCRAAGERIVSFPLLGKPKSDQAETPVFFNQINGI
jgi:hypothetical protein